MASVRDGVCRVWNSIRVAFGHTEPPPASDRVISEFFTYGSQYYVAGRWGMFAGLMPVAGNLHHHAIEMFLKGALSKTMTTEELKWKLGHRLPKIWKRFKREINDRNLTSFDKVIKELSKFEDIRYPDKLLQSGVSMIFNITKLGAAQSFVRGTTSVPQYNLCLEDIDELVASIFEIAGRNRAVYLRFMKEDAQRYIAQDNNWTAS
jgi:hypothetical protein